MFFYVMGKALTGKLFRMQTGLVINTLKQAMYWQYHIWTLEKPGIEWAEL